MNQETTGHAAQAGRAAPGHSPGPGATGPGVQVEKAARRARKPAGTTAAGGGTQEREETTVTGGSTQQERENSPATGGTRRSREQKPAGELRVTVLGTLRARLDDAEIDLGPARQRALFAVLAANAGRTVGRDELIAAVWGPAAPATATGSVYTYISGLRRALEPQRSLWSAAGLLTSGPAGYALQVGEDALDAAVFARLRAEAQQRVAAGDPAGALTALDAALALWHGEAYAGVAAPAIEVERQRLAGLHLATVEQRARLLLAHGGHDDLVAELTELVREHPLHEPLRELLMLALDRAGRTAEALAAYREARRTLVAELGVEPGQALQDLHQRLLAAPAEPVGTAAIRVPDVLPTHVAQALQEGLTTRPYVGRAREAGLLRGLVGDLHDGRGRSVWIEGEPGIGKSELLTVAFADAGARGCRIAWGAADRLGRRIPLRAIAEALGAEPEGPEQLIGLVRDACAQQPLVLIADDLQWADEASVLLWGRLAAATRQLPLLLVAAARPEPGRRELAQLRRGVQARGGLVLMLEPLSEPDVEHLFGELVGARPGVSLRALAPRTAGNPLYARELAGALLRRSAVRYEDGTAEVDLAVADVEPPASLLAAVRGTLSLLTPGTRDVLRSAAMLGVQFSPGDVAAVAGRPAHELVPAFEEAVAGNVLVDAERQLAFRHPYLCQAVYDGIPPEERAALRRDVAAALAGAGAPVTRVAEQLTAEGGGVDAWVVGWLEAHHAELAHRAPLVAADLLRQAVDTGTLTRQQREPLLVALVKLLFRLDQSPQAEAREAAELARDPYDRAEMRQLLAAMRYRAGAAEEAIALLRGSLADPTVPEIWRVRHRALLANFRRGDLSDLDAADRRAVATHAAAVAEGDRYAIAHALQTRWLIGYLRRRHGEALAFLDEALAVVADLESLPLETVGLHLDLLDNRVFTLQNLDRLDEAQRTLDSVAAIAARHRPPAGLQVAAAVHHYWTARWDAALAELGTVTGDAPGITFHGMREPGAADLLRHGVAALIAARRDDQASAAVHLDAAEAHPASSAERESVDFLLVARALVAEQDGRTGDALNLLTPVLRPEFAEMLRHQWLPDLARLALDLGETDIARQAADICASEAAREATPARAWAADQRCRALLTGDPGPALAAAAHYRAVGRRLECAAAEEDAAVLLATAGRHEEAAGAFAAAVNTYRRLGARWDLRRIQARFMPVGDAAPIG
ncbi:SARP family transcriptional regulator [Spirilliplanes yamanashiensis]|uniref:SARP family transcriptional regulator n=1 Tax=Spirilliplanes yamanashiensis TaxID=42233 RepID=A0A8J4DJ65_9ACTN|nr:SARP family transcriptional regulator [Spirilliplanes yamanashiensis]